MTDFAQFLQQHKDLKVGKRTVFQPQPNQQVICDPALESIPRLPIPEALVQAQTSLGCALPSGYKTFMEVLGPGRWGSAMIWHPDYLYLWDESYGDALAGQIPFAYSGDGTIDYIAFKAVDHAIYGWSHDPCGYTPVSNTFEEWIEAYTPYILKDPKDLGADFYGTLPDLTKCASPPRRESTGSPWPQIARNFKKSFLAFFKGDQNK